MVEAIQLMRQIAVRAIVTENFKVQVTNEISRNLEQIEAELQQLEFKSKRAIAELEKKAQVTSDLQSQIEALKSQMSTEKTRLLQLKEELKGQNQTVAELPLGSVVTQFTVETSVEVKVGENIFQRLEAGEIIIKDGIIQEIKL